jgi:2-oxoisovalerate dehydrogenase E1 component
MAFEDPNPVLFFEHKFLYRSLTGPVPEGPYAVPFGKARLVRSGSAATVVTYGLGVHWATDLVARRPDLDLEIIDLRTLLPWDEEAVFASVQRTNRVLVLHEDTLTGGIGAEISTRIHEACWRHLDAPVARCASLDTAFPFAAPLETQFLASSRLESALDALLAE